MKTNTHFPLATSLRRILKDWDFRGSNVIAMIASGEGRVEEAKSALSRRQRYGLRWKYSNLAEAWTTMFNGQMFYVCDTGTVVKLCAATEVSDEV